jgi:predicted transcriptional regulator
MCSIIYIYESLVLSVYFLEVLLMSDLTTGELEVMQVLWQHGELKPALIQEKFPRPIKNAALRFQLKVLLEKKHVVRRRLGKAYYYRALTPRQGALQKMARRMSEVFCQGSAVGLIAELIKNEKLSPEQIRELQDFAQPKKKKS